jgi:streptogramin lyase
LNPSASLTSLIFSPPSSLFNLPCSDFASRARLLWGLQSSLNLQCAGDHGPGVGGEDAEEEHGELWGFPLTAPRVKYVSNYSFPLAELNRTLTPIAGYDAGTASVTTIDTSNRMTEYTRYCGAVLGSDGMIYFVPESAKAVLDDVFELMIGKFDPSRASFSTVQITVRSWSLSETDRAQFAVEGSVLTAYSGGVLGPDGKIYFVPSKSNNIGVFDPSFWGTSNHQKFFSVIDISDYDIRDASSNLGPPYGGGVLGPDGKIYFAPQYSDHIGMFDPSSGVFSNIDVSSKVPGGGSKDLRFKSGVLGPDGKIYFITWSGADKIGVFEPSSGDFSAIEIPGVYNYMGSVLGPNGKIYFVPYDANNIGVFDPSSGPSIRSFSTIDISDQLTHTNKYRGGVLGPDGRIYFNGNNLYQTSNTGVLDPSTGLFSTINTSGKFPTNFGQMYYGGGVLGPDGKIYFVSSRGNFILVMEMGNQDLAYEVSQAGGFSPEWSSLLSPHFNKY